MVSGQEPTLGLEVQRCPRCEQELPETAYHPDKWGKRGHYCRPCILEYKRRWRRARGVGPRKPKAPRAPKPRTYSTTYRAVHKQVQRVRGHASTHPCIHCCGKAEEWAYDHADPDALVGKTDRGITVEYSTDPTRYLPLCKPCHSRFDARSGTTASPPNKPVTKW